jgi:hypothetical protein
VPQHRPAQVSQSLVRIPQPLPGPAHRGEGVLHYVLGSRSVAHQQRGKPHERQIVGGVQLGQQLVISERRAGWGVVLQPAGEPGQAWADVVGGGVLRRLGADHLLVHLGEEVILAGAGGVIPGGAHDDGLSSLPKGS